MRPALIVFHRWLALTASILIFLVSASGSALVFDGAIDRALNPGLWRVHPAGSMMSLDTIVARAQTMSLGAPVTAVAMPPEPDRAVNASAGPLQIYVDPFTGRVLGTRDRSVIERSLSRRLRVLHTSLMTGRVGKELVGLVALASFLLVLTGSVIWWKGKLWRIRWSGSWKRIIFDLHHSLGVFAALVLFVITASGAAIHYDVLTSAIARLHRVPELDPPKQPPGDGTTRSISADAMADSARAAIPGARISFLLFPTKRDQPLVVAMRFPEDRTPGGRSRVYIDRVRGTVLAVENTRSAAMGKSINNVMRSAHTGDLFGTPTEVIWLLASAVLASQAITGVIMWWNGRAARAALARRSA